jgi:hypothetical protein
MTEELVRAPTRGQLDSLRTRNKDLARKLAAARQQLLNVNGGKAQYTRENSSDDSSSAAEDSDSAVSRARGNTTRLGAKATRAYSSDKFPRKTESVEDVVDGKDKDHEDVNGCAKVNNALHSGGKTWTSDAVGVSVCAEAPPAIAATHAAVALDATVQYLVGDGIALDERLAEVTRQLAARDAEVIFLQV